MPTDNQYIKTIPVLTNLKHLYIACSLEGQQLLLNKEFEVGIKNEGTTLGSPMINPALVDNFLAIKEKGLLLVEQPDEFLLKSWSCTLSGNRFERLSRVVGIWGRPVPHDPSEKCSKTPTGWRNGVSKMIFTANS